MFDVNQFLNGTIAQPFSTQLPLPPIGEHIGQVTKVEGRSFPRKDGSGMAHVLDVSFTITSANVPGTVRFSAWLDLTEDGSNIDYSPGRNVSLGRLREALGQNISGQQWSPQMMIGAQARILVSHSPDGRYANVDRVMPVNPQMPAGAPTVAPAGTPAPIFPGNGAAPQPTATAPAAPAAPVPGQQNPFV